MRISTIRMFSLITGLIKNYFMLILYNYLFVLNKFESNNIIIVNIVLLGKYFG